MTRVTIKQTGDLDKIAKSREMAAQLEPIADAILDVARDDPNEAYVASLRKELFTSRGRAGRVSWLIGAHPVIGSRVEAKRGTLARAVGRVGL